MLSLISAGSLKNMVSYQSSSALFAAFVSLAEKPGVAARTPSIHSRITSPRTRTLAIRPAQASLDAGEQEPTVARCASGPR